VVTKSELTGSLGVYAERREVERKLFSTLSVEQLSELANDSEALVNKALLTAQQARPAILPAAAEKGDTTSAPLPAEPLDNAHGGDEFAATRSGIDVGDSD
jgi:hypothetical protein